MTGATLSEVYQQARHSLLIVRDGLERLERLEFPQGPPLANSFTSDGAGSSSSNGRMVEDHALGRASPDLIQALKRDLTQLENHCVEMERLWRLQLPKTHRDLWKRKIEQVAEEVVALKTGLDKYLVRQHRRQLEAQERANLFQRVNGDSARVLEIFDAEQVAVRSARNSSTMLEDALSTGAAVLAKYAEQRERLKSAQRKALDILNTVGLSNSLLRIIEKRHRMDKWISYAGMFVVITVVIVFWRWTH